MSTLLACRYQISILNPQLHRTSSEVEDVYVQYHCLYFIFREIVFTGKTTEIYRVVYGNYHLSEVSVLYNSCTVALHAHLTHVERIFLMDKVAAISILVEGFGFGIIEIPTSSL